MFSLPPLHDDILSGRPEHGTFWLTGGRCSRGTQQRMGPAFPSKSRLCTEFGKPRFALVDTRQEGPKGEWYEARAVLHLPTGTLAAEADDKDPEVVLDQVADTLVVKIERHIQ